MMSIAFKWIATLTISEIPILQNSFPTWRKILWWFSSILCSLPIVGWKHRKSERRSVSFVTPNSAFLAVSQAESCHCSITPRWRLFFSSRKERNQLKNANKKAKRDRENKRATEKGVVCRRYMRGRSEPTTPLTTKGLNYRRNGEFFESSRS